MNMVRIWRNSVDNSNWTKKYPLFLPVTFWHNITIIMDPWYDMVQWTRKFPEEILFRNV